MLSTIKKLLYKTYDKATRRLQRAAGVAVFAARAVVARWRPAAGLNSTPRTPRVILSLTTYKQRITTVHLTIRTLLSQSAKPDGIMLWIFEDDLKTYPLPEELTVLVRLGLTLKFLDEDLKSYKKLVPALQEFPHDIIVTCDDDVYYPRNFLRALLDAHRSHPDAVIAHRCVWMKKQGALLAPYISWRPRRQAEPSFNQFPTGVGGVLYPPGALHVDVLRKDLFMKFAPTNDDIWFKFMALLNGTKTLAVNANSKHPDVIHNTQGEALWKINTTVSNANDRQITLCLQHYTVIGLLD